MTAAARAGIVAVTGATGFVGAACARQLAQAGWQVRILARRMPQAALMPDHMIEVVLGDLDDRASLERLVTGTDAILHCAGLVKALTAGDFFAVNDGGTESILLAAAQAAPTARFIHMSSLAAREPGLSPYAASKSAAEAKVTALAGPRDHVALRPPAVYGPGDHELLPLFKAAKLGILAYPASPSSHVATLHVHDLASAVVALLATPAWTQPFLEIDDGAAGGHSWPEILAALATIFGQPRISWRLPRPLMLPIAAGMTLAAHLTGQPQVLSLTKVPELYHPDWTTHGPKLSDLVDWRPRFTLTAGFADTAGWYRAQGLI